MCALVHACACLHGHVCESQRTTLLSLFSPIFLLEAESPSLLLSPCCVLEACWPKRSGHPGSPRFCWNYFKNNCEKVICSQVLASSSSTGCTCVLPSPRVTSRNQQFFKHAFFWAVQLCFHDSIKSISGAPRSSLETWSLVSTVPTVVTFHWDQPDGGKPKQCHLENNFGFRAGTGEARVNQNLARRHGKAMQHLVHWLTKGAAVRRTEGINQQHLKSYGDYDQHSQASLVTRGGVKSGDCARQRRSIRGELAVNLSHAPLSKWMQSYCPHSSLYFNDAGDRTTGASANTAHLGVISLTKQCLLSLLSVI